MVAEIDDPITVGVVFSRAEVRPVWFSWHGRQIRIRENAYSWKTREGSSVVLHFSVTDGQGIYEIRYNKETMDWKLVGCQST